MGVGSPFGSPSSTQAKQGVLLNFAGATSTSTTQYLSSIGVSSNVILPSQTLAIPANSVAAFTGVIVDKQQGSTNVATWIVDGALVVGSSVSSATLAASNVTLAGSNPAE